MVANIKQYDFLFGNHQCKCNAVFIGEADGMATIQLAAQRMQLQMRLEMVFLNILDCPKRLKP